MKLNKFAVIATALFAFSPVVAFAAEPVNDMEQSECSLKEDCARRSENRSMRHACRAEGACSFEGLELTDAQRESLQKIHADRRQAKASGREERRAAARTERSEYLSKIKEVLTPEQYVKFLENEYMKVRVAGGRDFRKAKTGVERRFNAAAHHDRTPRREAPKPSKMSE